MKKILQLETQEIEQAVRAWLKAKNPHMEYVEVDVYSRYVAGEKGPRVFAQITCQEPPDDASLEGKSLMCAKAHTNRDATDFLTGEEIPAESVCYWIDTLGITRVPVEEWPPGLREATSLAKTPEEAPPPQERPGQGKVTKKRDSSASAARDILGGSGGHLDRSSGLARGIKDD